MLILLGVCTVGLSTFSARPASAVSASDRAAAQTLFDRAKRLMSEGKFAEACPALEESERIEARSGTLLNLADCYEHAGRLASAWSTFLDAAALAKTTGNIDREQGARERAAALAPRLSKLVILLQPSANLEGLEILRDGDPVGRPQLGLPVPADSGPHVVAAQAPGRKPWRTTVLVEAGAVTATVTVPELERVVEQTASAGEAGAAPGSATAPLEAPAPSSVASTPPAPVAVPATPVERASIAASSLGIRLPTPGGPDRAASMDPHPGRQEESDERPSRTSGGLIAGGIVTGLFAAGTVATALVYDNRLREYNTANAAHADNRDQLHSQTKTLGVVNLALLGGALVAAGVTVVLWAHAPSRPAGAAFEVRGVASSGLTGLMIGYRQ